MGASGSPRSHRDALRARLLAPTLERTRANVPGYRRAWGARWDEFVATERLEALPVVTKARMLADPESFLDPEPDTAAVQRTGGSTGKRLVLHRSAEELRFIQEFFLELQGDGAPDREGAVAVISAMGSHHGKATPVPYRGPVTSVDFTGAEARADLEELFVRGPDGRRDALFVGLESQVRIATCKLVEAGFDFGRSRVAALITTGDFVTGRIRRWLEATWNAPLRSRYSLSEVFGGADRCTDCGAYHCDPHLVPEVIDPFHGTIVERGTGVLVLTCLYPFVQKQPMVRYFTGDVVTVVGTDCPVDRPGFELRGRLSSCVLESTPAGAELLLAGHDLYDVLDELPDVNASSMFPGVVGVADRSALGHVKARVEHESASVPRKITVSVELRYAHYLHPERARAVTDAIRDALLARSPALARELAQGRASLAVVPALPGTLESFQPDEVE